LYSTDPKKFGRFIGWPKCDVVPEKIQEMKYPGLTYFSWGSHQAQRGSSEETMNTLLEEVFEKEYFKHAPTLFALTTAVDATLIPQKFGTQQMFRNNERIMGVNDLQVEAVSRSMSSYPIYSKDGSTSDAKKPYFPIFDLFSISHSSTERLHSDAVHFWFPYANLTKRLLIHWLHYAPQLHHDNISLDRLKANSS
jgi:hypothetical protein